jgi:hypothetical protein
LSVDDHGWIIGAYNPGILDDVTSVIGADHGPSGESALRMTMLLFLSPYNMMYFFS